MVNNTFLTEKSDSEYSLLENEELIEPISKHAIVDRLDERNMQKNEYFKTKGAHSKIYDSNKTEDKGGITKGLFALLNCCTRRD